MSTDVRRGSGPTVEAAGERLLPTPPWRRQHLHVPRHGPVTVAERGDGPPLVLLHGTGSSGPAFAPLLRELDGVRAIVPDRPGQGTSTHVAIPRRGFRSAAVAWVDALLDGLGLEHASLLGHSMGGLWATWYALAHPERVDRLVAIGPPQLPGTRAPLPYRVRATPGLWAIAKRLTPPTRASVHRFASFVGEGEAIRHHPDVVDLFVAEWQAPTAVATCTNETRAVVSPLALVTPTGFRRALRVRHDELRRLDTETLLVWGRDEPLGGPDVAEAVVASMTHGRVAIVPGGHAPWLDDPVVVATTIADFLSEGAAGRATDRRTAPADDTRTGRGGRA